MELKVRAVHEIRLPERLDRAALAAFRADVLALDGEPVAVVRGAAESAFCRGISFDLLDTVDAVERDAGLADFEHAALALVTARTRTVARIRGDAFGGGLGVAAACDVVVASEASRFALPEPLFGLIPGLVLPLIRSRVGGPVLRRLALAGESVDAREACRLGLVDEVAADDELDERVAWWARRLDRAEPDAAGRLKRWLAELDDLPREVPRGRVHLSELLGSEAVTGRIRRYQQGLTPWGEDDDAE
jgi:enoyl-CoA hydratase/carnithine racemase